VRAGLSFSLPLCPEIRPSAPFFTSQRLFRKLVNTSLQDLPVKNAASSTALSIARLLDAGLMAL